MTKSTRSLVTCCFKPPAAVLDVRRRGTQMIMRPVSVFNLGEACLRHLIRSRQQCIRLRCCKWATEGVCPGGHWFHTFRESCLRETELPENPDSHDHLSSRRNALAHTCAATRSERRYWRQAPPRLHILYIYMYIYNIHMYIYIYIYLYLFYYWWCLGDVWMTIGRCLWTS